MSIPAFPLDKHQDGMTLRDYFASKALFQLPNTGRPAEEIARNCYALADAMLTYRGTPFTPEEDALLHDLLDSLRDVLSLIDRGLLVRDINIWNLDSRRRLVAILSKAERNLAKAEGK